MGNMRGEGVQKTALPQNSLLRLLSSYNSRFSFLFGFQGGARIDSDHLFIQVVTEHLLLWPIRCGRDGGQRGPLLTAYSPFPAESHPSSFQSHHSEL